MLRTEAGLTLRLRVQRPDRSLGGGIGFTVALKGNEEPVGRDAPLKRKESPHRVLVGSARRRRPPATAIACISRAPKSAWTSG
jgi:hypothetical protein